MISLLITILIAVLVVLVLVWVITLLPLPSNIQKVAQAIIALIFLLWVLGRFVGI